MGHGWAEFAGTHGLGLGWFVVLGHEGGGVLTVKVFDTTCCLREFTTCLAAAGKSKICKKKSHYKAQTPMEPRSSPSTAAAVQRCPPTEPRSSPAAAAAGALYKKFQRFLSIVWNYGTSSCQLERIRWQW